MNSLVATVNYGGRVTDDKDKRLIIALLLKYFTPDVIIYFLLIDKLINNLF